MAKAKEVLLSVPASNVEFVVLEDGRHAVCFDPKKSLGMSKSGKSKLIATTNGNLGVADYTAGINIYRKA